jgi:hypothetical protein
MSKQKAAEQKVIFRLTLYERPAMSAAIQATQVREALTLAVQQVGGANGRKLRDELLGPFDQETMTRPAWGDYEFLPTAPP